MNYGLDLDLGNWGWGQAEKEIETGEVLLRVTVLTARK